MGARRSPSLGTVFSQSDSSGRAVTWRPRLARLFYKGKLVSDRRCRNDNPNRVDQSRPLKFGGSSSRHCPALPSITLLSVDLQYNSGVAHLSSRTSLGQAISL